MSNAKKMMVLVLLVAVVFCVTGCLEKKVGCRYGRRNQAGGNTGIQEAARR